MNSYETKQIARADRIRERGERKLREGSAAMQHSRDMISAIPMGQPILVGHHSEGRDRRYRDRAWNKMGKGISLHNEGAEAIARAKAIEDRIASGDGPISSDDPDAASKFREKLAGMEKLRDSMKAANRVIRAKPRNQPTEEKIEKLNALGIKNAAEAFEPDCCGQIGFAAYQLQNLGANIRRVKERLAAAEQRAEQADQDNRHHQFGTVEVIENFEENRLQIFFPGKPSADMRTSLKRHGFRWAPSVGAWQRQLNGNARFAFRSIRAAIEAEAA